MPRHYAREKPAKEIGLGELNQERALDRLPFRADVPPVHRNPPFSGHRSVLRAFPERDSRLPEHRTRVPPSTPRGSGSQRPPKCEPPENMP